MILQNEIWKKSRLDRRRVKRILDIFEKEDFIKREWIRINVNGQSTLTKIINKTTKGEWFWQMARLNKKNNF